MGALERAEDLEVLLQYVHEGVRDSKFFRSIASAEDVEDFVEDYEALFSDDSLSVMREHFPSLACSLRNRESPFGERVNSCSKMIILSHDCEEVRNPYFQHQILILVTW